MLRWLGEIIHPVGGSRFKRNADGSSDRGATMVEFTIVFLIIFLFLISIFELCRFFAVEAMARASVREMQRLITVKKEMTVDTRTATNSDVSAMLTTISNVATNFASPMISPSSATGAPVRFLEQEGEDLVLRDGAVLRPGRQIKTIDTATGSLVPLQHQTCPVGGGATCPQWGDNQTAFNQMVIDHPIFARVCYSYTTFVPLDFMGLGTFRRCVTAADYIETVGRPSHEAGVTSTTHSSTTTSTSTTTATTTSTSATTVSTVSSTSTSISTSVSSVSSVSSTSTSATSSTSNTTISTSSTTQTTSQTSSTTVSTTNTSSTTQTTSQTSQTSSTTRSTSQTSQSSSTTRSTSQTSSTTRSTSQTSQSSSTTRSTSQTSSTTQSTSQTSSTTRSTTQTSASSTSTSATTTTACPFPTNGDCATHCIDPQYCGYEHTGCDCQCLINCL